MKSRCIVRQLFIFSSVFFLASCGGGESSSSSSSEASSSSSSSSWTQGSSAISGAEQPSLHTPTRTDNTLQKIRASQKRSSLPSIGDVNILVVPVDFTHTDKLTTKLNSLVYSNIDSSFFEESDSYPCVSQFYSDSSSGLLTLEGVTSPTVTIPMTITDALLKTMNLGAAVVRDEIAAYVYDYLFVTTGTYNPADFDSDNDGSIDAMELVLNFDYGHSFDSSTYTSANQSLLAPTATFSSSYSAVASNLKVNSYGSASVSFVATKSQTDSHAFISVVGEQIGLPSYSDLTGTSSSTYRAPIGYVDPESGYIGDHNPFSKYLLGWNEPQFVNASSITSSNGLKVTLEPSYQNDDCLILSTATEANPYGEYLIIDYYTPEGVNGDDSSTSGLYGTTTFDEKGIRVYKVDSRLARGYADIVMLYSGDPDFEATRILENGEKVKYFYDFAYSNDSVNPYSSNGISDAFPLLEFLSSNESNRHMTNDSILLTADDMFMEGDSFGSDDQIEGFYHNFSFDGDGIQGDKLGLTFTVDSLTSSSATLTIKEAK